MKWDIDYYKPHFQAKGRITAEEREKFVFNTLTNWTLNKILHIGRYNPKIEVYTTSISNMNELGEMLAKQGGKKWSTSMKQRN